MFVATFLLFMCNVICFEQLLGKMLKTKKGYAKRHDQLRQRRSIENTRGHNFRNLRPGWCPCRFCEHDRGNSKRDPLTYIYAKGLEMYKKKEMLR